MGFDDSVVQKYPNQLENYMKDFDKWKDTFIRMSQANKYGFFGVVKENINIKEKLQNDIQLIVDTLGKT
jgi:hypothetical protein